MDPDRWQRIKTIFQEAAELAEPERLAHVREACDGDDALATEIMGLFDADTRGGESIGDIVGAASASLGGELPAGERIGPYQLVRIIGQGGMGYVYLAERADQEFDQRVAIKTVHYAGVSPTLIERFRLERQILASLEHPNIARLLDGGRTESGIPYLVMEYVEGQSIIDHVSDAALPVDDRIRLFLELCDAVQYAHRKLVVHRDIKPSNILLTPEGVPKLLDFGIAKFLDPDSAPDLTRAEARVLTPEYASPEQVLGMPVTTATDVYGLGLILYQLLAGTPPFDLSSRTSPEIRELICNTEPDAPSMAALGIGRNDLAARVRGDLDRVVLKALRKEPERRYETVKDLADDLRNFQNNLPVSARRDSAGYRARKFLQRHRTGAIATLAVVVAISLQTIIYTSQLTRERDAARLQAQRAEEVAGFMTELFAEANPSRNLGSPLTARQMLDLGASRIRDELAGQPDLQAALMVTIAESYENMEENVAARDYLAAAVPSVEQRLGKEDPNVLLLRHLLGSVMTFVGDGEAARPIHEENLAIEQRLHGEESAGAARELSALAAIDSRSANYERAEENFIRTLAIYRTLGVSSEDKLAGTLIDYGSMLRRLDRGAEEEPMLLEALAIQARRVGRRHPDYAAVVNNLGNHFYRRGDLATARGYMEEHVELQRELNGGESVPYGVALVNFATLVRSEGDSEQALLIYTDALDILAKGYGPDAPRYAYLLENVANTMMDVGQYDEAEEAYAQALEILAQRFGLDHPEYAFTQRNLGASLGRMGRHAEAVPELRAAMETWIDAHGPLYSRVITTRTTIATNLIETGDFETARDEAFIAARAARESMPENSQQRLNAVRVSARAHHVLGDYESSNALYQESLDIAGRLGAPAIEQTTETEIAYARSLAAQGDQAEARRRLDAQLAALDDESDPDGELAAAITETLGEI